MKKIRARGDESVGSPRIGTFAVLLAIAFVLVGTFALAVLVMVFGFR